MAKRPCARPGCPALVERGGYCDGCKGKSPRAKYDKQRGNANERGYTYRWQKYSKARLRREPLCVGFPAGMHGERVALAEHTDHIVAVSGPGDPRFWEEANHQSLCGECHSRKTATEDGGFGRGKSRKAAS